MKNQKEYDIVIVGGGLAGLTSAIHLSKKKLNVLLIEKSEYPKHKVCGEYISNEVLPYLQHLGINPQELGAKQISEFEITTRENKKATTKLPLGGFGISRYCFDAYLATKATESGALICQEMVLEITYQKELFNVTTDRNNYSAKFVIGSFGKRSNLDVRLKRKFIQNKSDFLAVKIHVKGEFPENKVALHNFKGGYCGVSKTENEHINVCYLTDYKSFKQHKSIQEFQEKVLYENKELKKIFSETTPVFKEPLTISQISFDKKPLIESHVLMCGDSAAMIHPLCGNGMGMAIASAKILSTLLSDFYEGKIKSRSQLEKMYLTQWNKQFKTRLFFGYRIASVFRNDFATKIMWRVVKTFPFLLTAIIKKTHGKPIKPL